MALPVPDGSRRALAGIAFLAGCTTAYDAYSAACSSPQTTELFAKDREVTLMRWVKLGGAQAIILVTIASWISRSAAPIIGGVLVSAIMHGSYKYAAHLGKQQAPPAGATPTGPTGATADRIGRTRGL